jgi:hypothetical protein
MGRALSMSNFESCCSKPELKSLEGRKLTVFCASIEKSRLNIKAKITACIVHTDLLGGSEEER